MARPKITLDKVLPYLLLIGGIIGYLCAFIIMYDKIELLKDPNFKPDCNLNPVISCGNIMSSKQSGVFGFPNPFIGLGAFPVVAVIGGAMLAGARFKRWFWLGFEAGLIFAVGFVHWLFFESVYRIHSLCPYCMVVWAISIISFWYVTLYLIDHKYIRIPATGGVRKIYGFIRKHHLDILILWLLIIAALILKHFWYYYGRYF